LGRKQESSLVMKSVKESKTNVFKKFKMSFYRGFEFFEHALKSNIKKLNQKIILIYLGVLSDLP